MTLSTAAAPVPPTTPAPGPRSRVGALLAERPVIALTGLLVVLYLVTGALEPSLFTVGGVRSILLLACPLAIFAASQTLCMLTGGIDLSVALTANLAAYIAANRSGDGTLSALLLALFVGLLVGAINGVGVGVFKVNPLIMTLGMASVLLGVVTVGLIGDGFLAGSTRLLPVVRSVGSGTLIGPIPANTVVWLVLGGLIVLGLSRSGLGRMIYAVGDNPVACRLAGVRVWQVLLAVYVLAGLFAAIGGLLFSGISGSVGPDQTNAYLLPSVAAAVIGGTSILGGSGGYTGTILGALILTVLGRLLLSLDTTEAVRQVLYGLIVLVLAWVYVKVSGQRAAA
ncbi:MAG TPA: ABC transporter permease [Propionibacteriaceae bacterium]|jgi:ribose transport system permease protein|nr:ABC transporter permease [Propionibacteriaceae bacterium]